MSQRKFLEDDENINGDGQPKRYAASTEVRRMSEKQNTQSSSKELFEMLGIIAITYVSIIIVWIICIVSIDANFQITVIVFIILFIAFVIFIALYWRNGLQKREQLMQQLIQSKMREFEQ